MSKTVFIILKQTVSRVVTNPINGDLKIDGGNRGKQVEFRYVDAREK